MIFHLPPLTDLLLRPIAEAEMGVSLGEVFDLAFVTDVTYVTVSQLEPVTEAEIWLLKYFHWCIHQPLSTL